MRLGTLVLIGLELLALGCSKDSAIDASQNTNTTECGDNTLDCVPCGPGEHRCDDAILKVCQDDGQGFDPVGVCVSEALCVKGLQAGACASPECSSADTKCEGSTMWICSPARDELTSTECTSEAACLSGLANGVCGTGECVVPSDCVGVDTECHQRTCVDETCGTQNLSYGIPVTDQVDGDCKRRVCDGQGSVISEPSPTDIVEDGNDCTLNSCEGAEPKVTWASVGTPCGGTGVCDHSGTCVACLPGSKRCKENAVQVCEPTSQWDLGTECVDSACVGGECVGVCVPGSLQCQNNGVQECDAAGNWGSAQPCADSACVGGTCMGVCVPGTTRCEGNNLETCDASGSWGSSPCQDSACVAGECIGACEPGAPGCHLNTPSTCDDMGQWVALGAACSGATPICRNGGCVACPGTGGPTMVAIPVPNGNHYCIDSTEVTRGQYAAWLATNPDPADQTAVCSWNLVFHDSCDWPPGATNNHPANCMNWCDAYAYCRAVGKRMCGKIGGGSNGYSEVANALESQWYRACSSGGQYVYPYGDEFGGITCNTAGTVWDETVAAGSMGGCRSTEPGFGGVWDLSGNVSEWEDSCDGSTGAHDNCRMRGGSYVSDWGGSMCWANESYARGGGDYGIGFRCCSDP